jgi:hypothetical protein
MRIYVTTTLLTLALASMSLTFAGAPVTSKHQACLILKRAAVERHLSIHDLSGRYYCECATYPSGGYFHCTLRYTLKPNDDSDGFLGTFAIRASDGKLFDWNDGDDEVQPLAERPPFQKDSN